MTSFAECVVAAALLAAADAGVGGAGPGARAAVPAPLAARVAQAIAERWSVEAGDLTLEWSAVPGEPLAPDAPFRLLGAGQGGRFVVTLAPAGAAPCALRLRAGLADTVAVAARAIAPGARLNAADVAWETRLTWGPPRALTSRPGPGWQARRAIAPGEPLAWPAVVRPPVIASGDPVRLTWSRGDVSVTLAGTALQSAAPGERLRARVDGRATRVEAIATGPGTATLTEEGGR